MTFLYPKDKARLKSMLHERQGGQCCYCGRITELHPSPWALGERTPPQFATLEHLRRKSEGGTDHPDNLAIACFDCNVGRGSYSWVEWKTLKMQARAA